MSVDVDIYMNGIQKFFRDNPEELLNLIPKEKEEEFYVKIREVSLKNFEEKNEAGLTQKQLLEICRKLNQTTNKPNTKLHPTIVMTPFGGYSLN